MRLPFNGFHNPGISALGIVFLTLLLLASAEDGGSTTSAASSASLSTESSTMAAESASESTEMVSKSTDKVSTTTIAATTTMVEATTEKKIYCHEPDDGITSFKIIKECQDETSIILPSIWLDFSEHDEVTLENFLANKKEITNGGISLVNNTDIASLNLKKLQSLHGIEIVNTNLSRIFFIEQKGVTLRISKKIEVHGNRYLSGPVLKSIKSFAHNKVVPDVQEPGECIIDPENINLKDCQRVYGDLHLKNYNLSKDAPTFQPIAISGCLKIEKDVTLYESTFAKLIQDTKGHKGNNNCVNGSYVKTCIMEKLYKKLNESFGGGVENITTKGKNCQFTCKMSDIIEHNQEFCTIIDDDVVFDKDTKTSVQDEVLKTVEVVRGQIVINGTERDEIRFLKLKSIESNKDAALVVTNNKNLKLVKATDLSKLSAEGDKDWVVFKDNGEYIMDSILHGKLVTWIQENEGKDAKEFMNIDKVENTTRYEKPTVPDEQPKNPYPEGEDENKNKESNDENVKNEAGSKKEEEMSTEVKVGIGIGIFVLILLLVGGAVGGYFVYKKKFGKKEDEKKKDDVNLEKSHGKSLITHASQMSQISQMQNNDLGIGENLDEKKDPTMIDRIFNFLESIINTPVLPFRMWVMYGTESRHEPKQSAIYHPLMGDYFNLKHYKKFEEISNLSSFSHSIVKKFSGEKETVEENIKSVIFDENRLEGDVLQKRLVLCGFGMSKLKEKWKELGIERYTIEEMKEKKADKRVQQKPYPSNDVEVLNFTLTSKDSKDLQTQTLEFHNYKVPDKKNWIAESLDHFKSNGNLIRFVHWAYMNKVNFICDDEDLFLLVQMLLLGMFFIFDFKCCSSLDVTFGIHLCIVTRAMELLKGKSEETYEKAGQTWEQYPPEAGHAYALQVLNYILPYVVDKQSIDMHYGSICIKDFKVLRAEAIEKLKLKGDIPKPRLERKKKSGEEVSKQSKMDAPSKQSGVDEPSKEKEKDGKRMGAGKTEKKEKPKSNVKSGVKSGKAPQKSQKSGQKTAQQKSGKKVEQQKSGKNAEQPKSGQKSEVKSQSKSQQKQNSQKPASPQKSVMTTECKANAAKTKGLVEQYVKDTMFMNETVKVARKEKKEEVDWEKVWPDQAALLGVVADKLEDIRLPE